MIFVVLQVSTSYVKIIVMFVLKIVTLVFLLFSMFMLRPTAGYKACAPLILLSSLLIFVLSPKSLWEDRGASLHLLLYLTSMSLLVHCLISLICRNSMLIYFIADWITIIGRFVSASSITGGFDGLVFSRVLWSVLPISFAVLGFQWLIGLPCFWLFVLI